MKGPEIEVLGVYRLPVTEKLFREQFDILYGYRMSKQQRAEAERQCREQLDSVVLIEARVRNRDNRFDVGQFTQSRDGVPVANWQVAYDEAFLSPDGESLAAERGTSPQSPATCGLLSLCISGKPTSHFTLRTATSPVHRWKKCLNGLPTWCRTSRSIDLVHNKRIDVTTMAGTAAPCAISAVCVKFRPLASRESP
jgi:hypothetical protein